MPFSSLDLSLDPASDEAVRAGWQALEQQEIPSEGRRTSPTHRPHLTLLAAPTVPPDLLERAARDLRPLLPARLTARATVVFGRGPFVVAHLVVPDPVLRAAVADLRGDEGDLWIPHLTLSRKVPAGRLTDALRAAEGARPIVVVAQQLRHWDAIRHIVTPLT
ncbi:2'-5' RNA ligase family protein [Allobranchiibius sp. GilTou73]|uniref:2'-5' RNA ligase family protein n=1 Tax=Allobranchiibius sp. GilTou73 TaxID=2904523 RepID=UPI001F373BF8|nr:2'-5' RNA ligase family protein [Allobranchiibius sp. GilTou73]UIJ35467.1 2'-5' RNA ligase family protein [Allobranchiibius sp. GilTou73]